MFGAFGNWLRAAPWQVYPLWRDGWRYHVIFRSLRHGSPHPIDPFGTTYLAGGEPRGLLASLWGTVAFPHVHDEEDEDAEVIAFPREPKDSPPRPHDANQLAAYAIATSTPRASFEPDWAVPPGETIAELLEEHKMTPDDLAGMLDMPLRKVGGLLAGEEPVDAPTAAKLERLFGVSAGFWLAYEHSYRTSLDRIAPGCVVDLARDARIATLAEESGVDVRVCEFCGGPLDAEHPWRRGMDGACAHEACL
jgi:plasmid maintenance system antidote protein VapI